MKAIEVRSPKEASKAVETLTRYTASTPPWFLLTPSSSH